MRSSVALLAAVMTMLSASGLHAQCAFDAPLRAKLYRVDMIRAYAECPAPGDETGSCVSPAAVSAYEFDPKGKCSVRMKIGSVESCSTEGNYLDEPCQTLQLKSRCAGILEPGGGALIDGSPTDGWWLLEVGMRYTTDGFELGDRTIIDIPFQYSYSSPKNGKMRLDYLGPRDNFQFFGPPYRAYLSPCSSLELVSVRIIDPSENVFAIPGLSTR